jgi:hypothetical protein
VSSIAPNKPNLWRFWAGNEGRRKSKANPGGRGTDGGGRRTEDGGMLYEVRATRHGRRIAPNKANLPRFGAENGGGAKKQSQLQRAGDGRLETGGNRCGAVEWAALGSCEIEVWQKGGVLWATG